MALMCVSSFLAVAMIAAFAHLDPSKNRSDFRAICDSV
jgi:hypothetical protein